MASFSSSSACADALTATMVRGVMEAMSTLPPPDSSWTLPSLRRASAVRSVMRAASSGEGSAASASGLRLRGSGVEVAAPSAAAATLIASMVRGVIWGASEMLTAPCALSTEKAACVRSVKMGGSSAPALSEAPSLVRPTESDGAGLGATVGGVDGGVVTMGSGWRAAPPPLGEGGGGPDVATSASKALCGLGGSPVAAAACSACSACSAGLVTPGSTARSLRSLMPRSPMGPAAMRRGASLMPPSREVSSPPACCTSSLMIVPSSSSSMPHPLSQLAIGPAVAGCFTGAVPSTSSGGGT
jgi:hypothetical protein